MFLIPLHCCSHYFFAFLHGLLWNAPGQSVWWHLVQALVFRLLLGPVLPDDSGSCFLLPWLGAVAGGLSV